VPSAVADLVVIEEFLNTLDERAFTRHGQNHVTTDELTSPEALNQWMEAHGLATATQEPRPSDLTAALSLRAAVRESLSGADDSACVAQALAAFPLRLRPDASGRLHLAADTGVHGLDDRDQRSGGSLEPPQALRLAGLPLGLLRHLPQRRRSLVLDGGLREPPQDTCVPPAASHRMKHPDTGSGPTA
jgi:hypothetical protein